MPQWSPPRLWQPPCSAESLPLGTVPCRRAHLRTWRQRRPPLRMPAQQTPQAKRLVDAPHGGLAAARPSTSPSRCHRVRRLRPPPPRLHRRHRHQARRLALRLRRSPDHWPAGGLARVRAAIGRQRQRERQGMRTSMSAGMAGGATSASTTTSQTGAIVKGWTGVVAIRQPTISFSIWTTHRR